MKVLVFIIACVFLISQVCGFKVLGILTFGTTSHFAIGNAIVSTLHEAGHEVTVISNFPKKTPVENFTDIDANPEHKGDDEDYNMLVLGEIHPLLTMTFLYKMGSDIVHDLMNHTKIQDLLNSNAKFDVCVFELFISDALLGIVDQFDCILIGYTTFGAVKWINDMTSNQMPGSYVPNPMMQFTDKMNFYERLSNTFTNLMEDFVYTVFHLPHQRRLYEKYFPKAKKSFYEMYKSSAIIFMNTHVSSASARPYLPNMIEIGGVHIEPVKPLPKDIQEFLDSASDGAIIFTMGSVIKAIHWPEETRDAFNEAFGKLKQKVLWKYEDEIMPNKADNVMISPWIPQRDILAHPNIQLFITHGGLLGTTEALSEGVPVLGIPVYSDQGMNMAKAASLGFGLTLPMEQINERNVTRLIRELLRDPKYKRNAELISRRFADRPMAPKETVLYWTEYAFRHKGAPHLRAAGNSLGFIEFHLIDVYAVLALAAILILVFDYLFLKFILKRIFKTKTETDKKIKKN